MARTDVVLGWLARIGAADVDAIADACEIRPATALRRLRALEHGGLARAARLLHGAPALYALTRAGLRAAGRGDLDPVRVGAASFEHLMAVARVAAAIGDRDGRLGGERDLRAAERAAGGALASAEAGLARDGGIALHRPDLVLWRDEPPIAIEVELSVKAPDRLRTIVRGWARSRIVGGTVYYCSPPALRAVAGAVALESAGERVAVLALDRAGEIPSFPRDELCPKRAVASAATGILERKETRWQPSTAS